MKMIPKIEKYMTPIPETINKDVLVNVAYEKMQEGAFRHLPVQSGGKLVGILTDRDIKMAMTFETTQKLTVEDVMTQDPYTCSPDADLDSVVLEMAEHKYGSAVVQQSNGKIVGIFTATDALRVLGEVLGQRFKH